MMNYQCGVDKAKQVIANALTLEGEDYAQRQAFSMLMPQVSQLRSSGFSFQEIASLLKESGLIIPLSTVRDYYSEFNLLRMQEIVEEMDDQLQKLQVNLNLGNLAPVSPNSAFSEVNNGRSGLSCLPLSNGVGRFDERSEVPREVYCEGLLEHPAIPGLMLTKDERTYRSALEIMDANGDKRYETAHERRFRIKWQKPIPRTPSSSEKDFVTMDMSLFAKRR